MSNHSTTLRSSLDVIKSEMSLINELEKNRDSVSTREYVSLVQDSIDEKISQLEMLRERYPFCDVGWCSSRTSWTTCRSWKAGTGKGTTRGTSPR